MCVKGLCVCVLACGRAVSGREAGQGMGKNKRAGVRVQKSLPAPRPARPAREYLSPLFLAVVFSLHMRMIFDKDVRLKWIREYLEVFSWVPF